MTAPDDLARTLAEHRWRPGPDLWPACTCGEPTRTEVTHERHVAARLASVVSRRDTDLRTRIEALRTRLGQSEWIVCAEALRILDSTLCQYRHDGQVCILVAAHDGDHQMGPDTEVAP